MNPNMLKPVVFVPTLVFGLICLGEIEQDTQPTGSSRLPANPTVGTGWTESSNGMRFRYIPPGRFQMGSPDHEEDRREDETQHLVTLTRGFWMGETEVTQGEWQSLMGDNPSRFKKCGADCPVEVVTWFEAVQFANVFSSSVGLPECYTIKGENVDFVGLDCEGYRLPTEAEWEYAARAGTTTRFSTGNTLTNSQAEFLEESDNYANESVPVRSYDPNPWGLYDVHGNVNEMCWDVYGEYPVSAIDPLGADRGSRRSNRGGNMFLWSEGCRSAIRFGHEPGERGMNIGFRLARTAF